MCWMCVVQWKNECICFQICFIKCHSSEFCFLFFFFKKKNNYIWFDCFSVFIFVFSVCCICYACVNVDVNLNTFLVLFLFVVWGITQQYEQDHRMCMIKLNSFFVLAASWLRFASTFCITQESKCRCEIYRLQQQKTTVHIYYQNSHYVAQNSLKTKKTKANTI